MLKIPWKIYYKNLPVSLVQILLSYAQTDVGCYLDPGVYKKPPKNGCLFGLGT